MAKKIESKQRCEIRKMEQSRFKTATTLPSYNALPITRYTPTFVFHAEHLSGTELEHRKFNWSRREQHIRLERDAPAAPVQPLRFHPVGFNAKKRKKIILWKLRFVIQMWTLCRTPGSSSMTAEHS